MLILLRKFCPMYFAVIKCILTCLRYFHYVFLYVAYHNFVHGSDIHFTPTPYVLPHVDDNFVKFRKGFRITFPFSCCYTR